MNDDKKLHELIDSLRDELRKDFLVLKNEIVNEIRLILKEDYASKEELHYKIKQVNSRVTTLTTHVEKNSNIITRVGWTIILAVMLALLGLVVAPQIPGVG